MTANCDRPGDEDKGEAPDEVIAISDRSANPPEEDPTEGAVEAEVEAAGAEA